MAFQYSDAITARTCDIHQSLQQSFIRNTVPKNNSKNTGFFGVLIPHEGIRLVIVFFGQRKDVFSCLCADIGILVVHDFGNGGDGNACQFC